VAICNLLLLNSSSRGSSSRKPVSACAVSSPIYPWGHATTAWGKKNRLFFTSTRSRARPAITPPAPPTLPNFLENRLIPCRFRCVGGVGGIDDDGPFSLAMIEAVACWNGGECFPQAEGPIQEQILWKTQARPPCVERRRQPNGIPCRRQH
jgi:hypothetical protein